MPGSDYTTIKQVFICFSGSRSRHWFLLFVLSVLVNIYITDFFCYYISHEFGWDWALTIGTIEAAILTFAVTGLSIMMVRLSTHLEEIRKSSTFQNVNHVCFLYITFQNIDTFYVASSDAD